VGRKFTSAEVEITAADKTKSGIDSSKRSIGGLTSAIKAYGAEIGAALAAMYGVYKVIKDLTSAYIEQEEAVQNMDQALRSTGIYTPKLSKDLQDLAGELQGVTIYSDETIESATGLLQSFGDLSEQGLKQAIPLMLDFARATKTGPDEAARVFGKTLGSNTNALARYGLELEAGMTELEKLGRMQEWVNSHFRDAALIKSYADEFQNMKNLAGEYKEVLGRFILEAGHPFLEWLREMLKEQAGMQEMANVIRLFGATTFAVFKLNSDIIKAFMGYVYATTQSINILGDVAQRVLGGGLFSKSGRESIKRDLQDMGKMWADYGTAVENSFRTDIGKIIENYTKAFEKYDGTIQTAGASTVVLGEESVPVLIEFGNELMRVKSAIAGIEELSSPHIIAVEEMDNAWQEVNAEVETFVENENKVIAATTPLRDELKALQMSLEDMATYTAGMFVNSMVGGFDAVMSGARSLKEGLKDMIAGFLTGLGKMFFTQFLGYLLFAPRKAFMALAASVAAYSGAAVVRSLAKGGECVTNGPEMIMVGDNPSGRERVSVTPAESPAFSQGGGGPIGGDVYFDGVKVGRWIAKQVRAKQIPIYKGALVSS